MASTAGHGTAQLLRRQWGFQGLAWALGLLGCVQSLAGTTMVADIAISPASPVVGQPAVLLLRVEVETEGEGLRLGGIEAVMPSVPALGLREGAAPTGQRVQQHFGPSGSAIAIELSYPVTPQRAGAVRIRPVEIIVRTDGEPLRARTEELAFEVVEEPRPASTSAGREGPGLTVSPWAIVVALLCGSVVTAAVLLWLLAARRRAAEVPLPEGLDRDTMEGLTPSTLGAGSEGSSFYAEAQDAIRQALARAGGRDAASYTTRELLGLACEVGLASDTQKALQELLWVAEGVLYGGSQAQAERVVRDQEVLRRILDEVEACGMGPQAKGVL